MTDPRRLADQVLPAITASDLEAVRTLSGSDLLMYGTDTDERWSDVDSFCAALGPMGELGLSAEWAEPPTVGDNWIAGVATYRSAAGPPVLTRITLIFTGGRLVHGHFSLEGEMPVG